jgi:hypothetical protein
MFPVDEVRVKGRFPSPGQVDAPPGEVGQYHVLGPDPIHVVVIGHGYCDGSEIHPTCNAVLGANGIIVVEADLCCSSIPSKIGNTAMPPPPMATCSPGPLAAGAYTLLFRGKEVTTFQIPSIAHRSKLGRTFPLLPPPPDAGPPLDSASE